MTKNINQNVPFYMKDEQVKVASCTIEQLFQMNDIGISELGNTRFQLKIPEYQRPYAWGEKQVRELVSDLKDYNRLSDEKPQYYLGSILLHSENGSYNIIDGQQRLITLQLLLAASDQNEYEPLNIMASKSRANVLRNWTLIKDLISGNGEFVNPGQYNVTLVITESKDLAYTFFETHNTGGVRLTGSNIIKAHHLRSIPVNGSTDQVKYQARRWEEHDGEQATSQNRLERVLRLLNKSRYWNSCKFRWFPFRTQPEAIKSTLIDEFSRATDKLKENISYHNAIVKSDQEGSWQSLQSPLKHMRQPLSDGDNAMDYVIEYSEVYRILFEVEDHPEIDNRFYEFRKAVLHGEMGTWLLKDHYAMCLLCYVSRFGYQELYPVSLWLYRYVYSPRLTYTRNVREDSVFKFFRDSQLLDRLINSFTPQEFIAFLRSASFETKKENTDKPTKDHHGNTVNEFFRIWPETETLHEHHQNFDAAFAKAIEQKINK